MRNYVVLFAAVVMLSFSACYWVQTCWAQQVCTHKGQVCNFSISETEQCLNGTLSTSITVVGEQYGGNVLPSSGACGIVWNKFLGVITTKTDKTCGKAGNSSCY